MAFDCFCKSLLKKEIFLFRIMSSNQDEVEPKRNLIPAQKPREHAFRIHIIRETLKFQRLQKLL